MKQRKRGSSWIGPTGYSAEAGPPPAVSRRVAKEANRRQEGAGYHVLIKLPCLETGCSTIASLGVHDDGNDVVYVRGPFNRSDEGRFTLTGDRMGGHGGMFVRIPDTGDEIVAEIICRRGHLTELHSSGLRDAIAMARLASSSRAAE